MSCAPSTFGTMITSSLSPISVTRVIRSSSTHGESRLLILVHSWVAPKSVVLATSTRPRRAASLRSARTASSRLPSSTSTFGASAGSLAVIFALPGSKKWIIRDGGAGISRTGAGAPTASGAKKSFGERIDASVMSWYRSVTLAPQVRELVRRNSPRKRVELPGFTEIKPLGEGGFGRVVLARHDASGTAVAIKYLFQRYLAEPQRLAEFRREAQVLRRVAGDHISRLYEFVETSQGAAIVMEAVRGVPLREVLRIDGLLTPESALAVLKGSLLGL